MVCPCGWVSLIVGLLTQWLRAPSMSALENKLEAAVSFMTQPWKSHTIPSANTVLVEPVTGLLIFKGKGIERGATCHSFC